MTGELYILWIRDSKVKKQFVIFQAGLGEKIMEKIKMVKYKYGKISEQLSEIQQNFIREHKI